MMLKTSANLTMTDDWFRVYQVLILMENYLLNCVTKHGVMKMGRALRKDGF